MDSIIITWKENLKHLLVFYETKRGNIYVFFPLLFICFVLINIGCYWWAMFTAFPGLTHGSAGEYYFKIQFPVGFLGALFDSLSFFVTIYIIRNALCTEKGIQYVAHLSLDLIIAILATFWVVYVFSFSGWLIDLMDDAPQVLAERNAKYEGLLLDAVVKPGDNMRNIYFGLIMGVSAMVPTCVHIFMFLRSCAFIIFRQQVTLRENSLIND